MQAILSLSETSSGYLSLIAVVSTSGCLLPLTGFVSGQLPPKSRCHQHNRTRLGLTERGSIHNISQGNKKGVIAESSDSMRE
jgi:hypothetical protein